MKASSSFSEEKEPKRLFLFWAAGGFTIKPHPTKNIVMAGLDPAIHAFRPESDP
jgi:hypothetical protein